MATNLHDDLGEVLLRLEAQQLRLLRRKARLYKWKANTEPRSRVEAWKRWRKLEEKLEQ